MMNESDFAKEYAEVTTKVTEVCIGYNLDAVLAALATLIGSLEATSARPDIDDLMRRVNETARLYFAAGRDRPRRSAMN